MRCVACDAALTDFESSVRSANTGKYFDLCGRCLPFIRASSETKENFELFDGEVDDLDTNFQRTDNVAVPIEDDSTAGVTSDGERLSDEGGRYED